MQSAKRRWVLALVIVLVACVAIATSLAAVRGRFAAMRPESAAGGSAVRAGGMGRILAGRTYVNGSPMPSPPLIVVLHGDAPFRNPVYQYEFAQRLTNVLPHVPVVALLRPGYADAYGSRSDGDRGLAVGEGYTRKVVMEISDAIRSLKAQWEAPVVILVGHSGGAAVAADVAALNPDLIQHLFLVACPCDVPAFRAHMARAQWNPLWMLPVHSLSPEDFLQRLTPGTRVTAISGANDGIALPRWAQAYIAKARARGLESEMLLIPGAGHEILNERVVIDAVASSARAN